MLLLFALGSFHVVQAQTAKPIPAYVVHGGDQLAVDVAGDSTFSKTVSVLDDGSITYPLLGRMVVAGLSLQQVEALFAQRLQQYVRDPQVTVSIAALGQPSVMVLGNVKTPGRYELPSGAHLSNALAAAGGLGPTNGPFPEARVSDQQGDVHEVSLDKLLRGGEMNLDIPLSDGDVVYVPSPLEITVNVLGAVDHPGEVDIEQGSRLSAAVAKAGDSASSESDLNHIYLTRVEPDGTKKTFEIDLYKALQNGDDKYDVQMQKGDVVYVPKARSHSNGGVFYDIAVLLRSIFTGIP